jgi:hypothetical protein
MTKILLLLIFSSNLYADESLKLVCQGLFFGLNYNYCKNGCHVVQTYVINKNTIEGVTPSNCSWTHEKITCFSRFSIIKINRISGQVEETSVPSSNLKNSFTGFCEKTSNKF